MPESELCYQQLYAVGPGVFPAACERGDVEGLIAERLQAATTQGEACAKKLWAEALEFQQTAASFDYHYSIDWQAEYARRAAYWQNRQEELAEANARCEGKPLSRAEKVVVKRAVQRQFREDDPGIIKLREAQKRAIEVSMQPVQAPKATAPTFVEILEAKAKLSKMGVTTCSDADVIGLLQDPAKFAEFNRAWQAFAANPANGVARPKTLQQPQFITAGSGKRASIVPDYDAEAEIVTDHRQLVGQPAPRQLGTGQGVPVGSFGQQVGQKVAALFGGRK